ncbi:unnamed protein product [Orchesella dallaii]|uniref:Uncharacterized protein n=1 Tax=Orchesella dallaii TaxID=48710 RepID=A0ABP1RXU1_9HEXA
MYRRYFDLLLMFIPIAIGNFFQTANCQEWFIQTFVRVVKETNSHITDINGASIILTCEAVDKLNTYKSMTCRKNLINYENAPSHFQFLEDQKNEILCDGDKIKEYRSSFLPHSKLQLLEEMRKVSCQLELKDITIYNIPEEFKMLLQVEHSILCINRACNLLGNGWAAPFFAMIPLVVNMF